MERVEEGPHAVGILVHERLAADEAVGDEPRLTRDVLEARHVHGQERRKHG
jgi:hypothetical protein